MNNAGSPERRIVALAHSLRNEDGPRITAHLLIPGSTVTAMTSRGRRRLLHPLP